MPKQRRKDKGAPASSARVIRNKLRIGTRKTGKSGLNMSTEDLIAVVKDENKARYKNKALTILRMRGVDTKELV